MVTPPDQCTLKHAELGWKPKLLRHPGGAARMQDYERKLASEVEERVRRENKIAKTQSAHEPTNENITSTNTLPAMPASQPEDHNNPLSVGSSSATASASSTIVNPPSSINTANPLHSSLPPLLV